MNIKKLILILLIFLISGCTSNNSINIDQNTIDQSMDYNLSEYELELLLRCNCAPTPCSQTRIERWPNGIFEIYDSIGYDRLQEILDEINDIIGDVTEFRLSSNPESPVKIEITTVYPDGENFSGGATVWHESNMEGYFIKSVIMISPDYYKKYHLNDNSAQWIFYREKLCEVVGINSYYVNYCDYCIECPPYPVRTRDALKTLYRLPAGITLYLPGSTPVPTPTPSPTPSNGGNGSGGGNGGGEPPERNVF